MSKFLRVNLTLTVMIRVITAPSKVLESGVQLLISVLSWRIHLVWLGDWWDSVPSQNCFFSSQLARWASLRLKPLAIIE